ncbi:2747_t:CDS:1, partial [Acaulospora colombiana]
KEKENKSLEVTISEVISPASGLNTVTDSHSWSNIKPNSPVPNVAKSFEALGIRYEDLGGRTRLEFQNESQLRQAGQKSASRAIKEGHLRTTVDHYWSSFRRIFSS